MPDVTTTSAEAASDTVTHRGEAAFFDVDNTLMKGASLFHVARKMYQKKAFTMGDAAGFAWKQAKFIFRGENLNDVHSVQDSAQKLAAGISTDFVRQLGEEVYDEMIVSKIWPGTRALTQEHLRSGRQVWLVTATPVEVASVIADRLALTGALGTVAEIEDGLYTGKLVGEILHGPAKARAVQALAIEQGLDLGRCWAYSDSYNDIPLLTAVGNPVAINPDTRLRAHARDHNWPIYDFRSGRRAATLGLRAATGVGVVYGLWKGIAMVRRR
ncbi:HAD family hydrolase [Specibacter sp. RAF43]|uniref:HAD family hydrolase n=1 Tax=Specibacter sp. RAF43 TaxID=3233057 RepID=UPI003F9A0024